MFLVVGYAPISERLLCPFESIVSESGANLINYVKMANFKYLSVPIVN